MKNLTLLILALTVLGVGQTLQRWTAIKEMTGAIPNYPGLTIETYASEVARGDDYVKVKLRVVFPQGAPAELLRGTMPRGFDISSIERAEGRLKLSCKDLTVKPEPHTEIYQFNGKRHRIKERAFTIPSGHILEGYFCEKGDAPSGPPRLKP